MARNLEKLETRKQGRQAYRKGLGLDACLYDKRTDQYHWWREGWGVEERRHSQIMGAGSKAAREGASITQNPYDSTSLEGRWWREGWRRVSVRPDGTLPRSTCPHCGGRL